MLRFMCIGAQKAGTTWLYTQLRRHPDLSLLPKKEIHFWDIHYDRGIEAYQKLFADPDAIQADLTPAYAVLPDERIAECHRYFPDVRLLFIVREPVARLWSVMVMNVMRNGMDIDETPNAYFLERFARKERVQRGDYRHCMENWLKYYPREQLLILHFDDIAGKPEAFLKRCCRHIGISEELPHLPKLREKIFAGKPVPIRPSLLPVLQEFYGTSWEDFQAFVTRV